MDNIQIGDIIMVKPITLLNKVIAFLTKSKYAHCAVVYDIWREKNIIIMDADGSTVTRLRPLYEYEKQMYDVYRLKEGLTDTQKKIACNWMESHLGIEYDFVQIFGFIPRFLFGVDRIMGNPNKYICSELVDRVYNYLGIDLVEKYALGEITPEDIVQSNRVVKI